MPRLLLIVIGRAGRVEVAAVGALTSFRILAAWVP